MDILSILTEFIVPILTVGGLTETFKRIAFEKIKNENVKKWLITISPFVLSIGVSVGWAFPGGIFNLSVYLQYIFVNWAFASLIWNIAKRFIEKKEKE